MPNLPFLNAKKEEKDDVLEEARAYVGRLGKRPKPAFFNPRPAPIVEESDLLEEVVPSAEIAEIQRILLDLDMVISQFSIGKRVTSHTGEVYHDNDTIPLISPDIIDAYAGIEILNTIPDPYGSDLRGVFITETGDPNLDRITKLGIAANFQRFIKKALEIINNNDENEVEFLKSQIAIIQTKIHDIENPAEVGVSPPTPRPKREREEFVGYGESINGMLYYQPKNERVVTTTPIEEKTRIYFDDTVSDIIVRWTCTIEDAGWSATCVSVKGQPRLIDTQSWELPKDETRREALDMAVECHED